MPSLPHRMILRMETCMMLCSPGVEAGIEETASLHQVQHPSLQNVMENLELDQAPNHEPTGHVDALFLPLMKEEVASMVQLHTVEENFSFMWEI